MRTAHSAAKARRQSAKSTTPRKSVTCLHCLQPELQCNGQTPCLPCRKHQTLCHTNAALHANAQQKSPVVKHEEILERNLSTASSSSLPPDEAVNGFETEPSDISILSAREDHDQHKVGEDESLIDPRLRGVDPSVPPTEGGINNFYAGGEPGADSPFDSSSQAHHDEWPHGVPPPYPPYPIDHTGATWSRGDGYQSEIAYDQYGPPPAGSTVDFEFQHTDYSLAYDRTA